MVDLTGNCCEAGHCSLQDLLEQVSVAPLALSHQNLLGGVCPSDPQLHEAPNLVGRLIQSDSTKVYSLVAAGTRRGTTSVKCRPASFHYKRPSLCPCEAEMAA